MSSYTGFCTRLSLTSLHAGIKRLLLCLLFVPTLRCAETGNPLLVVVIMVKNEASVMAATLQPFADAGVNAYFVFDTGSDDDTIPVTRAFFDQRGITQGVIEQKPFINFAASRNQALAQAEQAFPNAGFFLMLDAEWHLHNVAGLVQFCAEHLHDNQDAYSVLISSSNEDFYTQRLIRPRRGVHFVGVVHECLDRVSDTCVPRDVFFELHTTRYGYDKTKARWVRDCALLQQEYDRNPNDPRTTFYLAQTYACLGDTENARIYYAKRCELPGWDEENFMARYRLGQVYEEQGNWSESLSCYLQAYSMRPTRIEPLVRIGQHYLGQHKYELSYLFLRRTLDKPYPAHDYLFIEKAVYDYVRYDLIGQCAWYTKDYEVGEAAVRQALVAQPNAPHLYGNLTYYVHRCLF
ncbi:tetratricopeptide repeat protein [Candidatus Dependentiae bacterium]|nr:tetratricopeptide repeat protein [Candidatus Dependentiae bacterium]